MSDEDKRCVSCGALPANTHHRLRRSQGGTDAYSHTCRLCGSGTTGCHGHAHANPQWALTLGYLVTSGEIPANVPLFHHAWKSWVLLRDDQTVKLIEPPPGNDARHYTPEENQP